MAETGGPTTQSGIYYQNTIAAGYMGALLDFSPSSATLRVVAVRVEAPEYVDDTVVTYADGHRIFIQAKEALKTNGEPWEKFWAAAANQVREGMNHGDEIHLVVADLTPALKHTRELLERTRGKDTSQEWVAALSSDHRKILESISAAAGTTLETLYELAKRTTIRAVSLQEAESIAERATPSSSTSSAALFSHFRDLCGGAARHRATFRAAELADRLLHNFNVQVFGSIADGLERYRRTILEQCKHIGIPGTSISSLEEELLVWPPIVEADTRDRTDFDDEVGVIDQPLTSDAIRTFPSADFHHVVLESGAGYGKSTLLRAITRRITRETSRVPAIFHAAALTGAASVTEYLLGAHNASYDVRVDWLALCEQGRAVVLIDGLDELDESSRAVALEKISRTSARFPDVPLLVATRDAAVATLPTQFKRFRIPPLKDEQISEMLKRYLRDRDESERRRVIQHVFAYREMETLCRVPLFLALFAATLPKEGAVPTSRTTLLERYLQQALSQERHKGTATPIGKIALRKSASAIALYSLEHDKKTLPEWSAQKVLIEQLSEIQAESALAELVQRGILQRIGTQVAFAIPSVQEYLAGCEIAQRGELQTLYWTDSIHQRPWAQSIQFAIEQLPSADSVLEPFLQPKDDLFVTRLRFAARCILNGARVRQDFRNLIGDKLTDAWGRTAHATSSAIGQMIADGFCRPLRPTLKEKLCKGEDGTFQRPMILRSAGDSAISLACLAQILEEDDMRDLWAPEWSSLLVLVSEEAIALLANRARVATSDSQAGVIAHALYALRNASYEWKSIADDASVPAVVRLAAQLAHAPSELPDEMLIEEVLNRPKALTYWDSFKQAYMSTPWWQGHLRKLVRDATEASNARFWACLEQDDLPSESLMNLVRDLAVDPLVAASIRFQFLLMLAILGSKDHLALLLEQVHLMDSSSIYSWASNIPCLPEETVEAPLALIMTREFSLNVKLDLMKILTDSSTRKMQGTPRSLQFRGPFRWRKTPPAWTNELARWMEQTLSSEPVDTAQSRQLVMNLAELGLKTHIEELRAAIEAYLASHSTIEHEDWTWFATALYTLNKQDIELEEALVFDIVKKGGDLPVGHILQTFLERQSVDYYLTLQSYFSTCNSRIARSAIISFLERRAEQHGLKVFVENATLKILRTKISV